MTNTLAFSYPRRNLCGDFATFRLGAKTSQKYPVDSILDCIDKPTKRVLVRCKVLGAYVGTLEEVTRLYGHLAHNWLAYPEAERPALLAASMKKRYAPGVVHDNSICSVIHLQEIQL